MSDVESFPRQSARTRRFTLGEPRSFTVCSSGGRVLFLRALSGTDPRTALWALEPSGEERLVVDPARLGDSDDIPAEERARRERARETASGVVAYSADAAGDVVAFAAAGEVWVVEVETGEPRRLEAAAPAFDPRPDPTGKRVAYVHGRSLRVIGVDGTGALTVADSDDELVSWGRAEFVAAEEMDRLRGYWWSPDGGSLLVAQVDETPVPTWWIADPAHPDHAPTAVRYPVAGGANADVRLHVISLDGGATEISWDRDTFPYVAAVSWADGHPPLVTVQTRDQRTVQILEVDVATGSTATRHEDSDSVWVEIFPGVPTWCGDRIVRIADTDGARRLFVGAEAVTPPELYLRAVVGADDDGVVFTASEDDPTQVHVFGWDSSGVRRLSQAAGVHGASYGAGTTVLSSSGMDHHGQRHRVVGPTGGDDREVRSVSETPSLTPQVRLLRLGERKLSAGLVLPRDHTPGTPLPVLMDPYGGPHAQRVLAARRIWLEPQWLADQGFAVLVVDGRGTPGRDPRWEREVSRDLATKVLDDQVDALRAAKEIEPDLDLGRVGIRGWSFGGFLSALAVLRRPDVFHAAVAGAPVTDWRLYDTHYTERYLGTPESNPAAYEQCSLLDDARSLSRPLLLIHGLADDNVAAANTLLLSQRLTEAGRMHTVLPLTGVTHMTPQESVAENLLKLQVEFLHSALG
ncbi:MAG TPA: prolyl oligopeptidase family serine peptidase [Mycobacteriales bacterium]|nr:prolyl oligopeptidase family serine peptidase [Mycobacteriales bacterium]